MPARRQTQSDMRAAWNDFTPEERKQAREVTDYLASFFRPEVLLAERSVLEMIEVMLIQAAANGSIEPQ